MILSPEHANLFFTRILQPDFVTLLAGGGVLLVVGSAARIDVHRQGPQDRKPLQHLQGLVTLLGRIGGSPALPWCLGPK